MITFNIPECSPSDRFPNNVVSKSANFRVNRLAEWNLHRLLMLGRASRCRDHRGRSRFAWYSLENFCSHLQTSTVYCFNKPMRFAFKNLHPERNAKNKTFCFHLFDEKVGCWLPVFEWQCAKNDEKHKMALGGRITTRLSVFVIYTLEGETRRMCFE